MRLRGAIYSLVFLFLSSVIFAQTITPSPTDTAAIVVTIHMVGASWTIDTLADGWDDEGDTIVGAWMFGSGTTYDSFYAIGENFDICECVVAAFWLENLGGITLDVEFKVNVGPDWILVSDAYHCEHLISGYPDEPDIAGMNLILTKATGFPDSNYIPQYRDFPNIPLPLNTWREADSLKYRPRNYVNAYPTITSTGTGFIAEDPASLSDGVFGTQKDQAEFFIYIMTPYLPVAVTEQIIKVWVRAKVCD